MWSAPALASNLAENTKAEKPSILGQNRSGSWRSSGSIRVPIRLLF
jgi:hypothetical protein